MLSFLPQGTTVTDAEVDALLKELEKPLPRTTRRSYTPSNRLSHEPVPLPAMPSKGAPTQVERAKYDPQSRNLVSEAAKAIGVEVKPRGPAPRMKLNSRPLQEIMAERRDRMARTENDRRNDELFSSLGLSNKTISAEEADAFLRDGTIPNLKTDGKEPASLPSPEPETIAKADLAKCNEATDLSQVGTEAPSGLLPEDKDKASLNEGSEDNCDGQPQIADECAEEMPEKNQGEKEPDKISEPEKSRMEQTNTKATTVKHVNYSGSEQPNKQAEYEEMAKREEPNSEDVVSGDLDKDVTSCANSSANQEDNHAESSSTTSEPADISRNDNEKTRDATPADALVEPAGPEPESNVFVPDVSVGSETDYKNSGGDIITDNVILSGNTLEDPNTDVQDLGSQDDASHEGMETTKNKISPEESKRTEILDTQDTGLTEPASQVESSDVVKSHPFRHNVEGTEDDVAFEPSMAEPVSISTNHDILEINEEPNADDIGNLQTGAETCAFGKEATGLSTNALESTEDQVGRNDRETADIDKLEVQKQDAPSMNDKNASSGIHDVRPEGKGVEEPTDDRVLAFKRKDTSPDVPPFSTSSCKPAENGRLAEQPDAIAEELELEGNKARVPVNQVGSDKQEVTETNFPPLIIAQSVQDSPSPSNAVMEPELPGTAPHKDDQDLICENSHRSLEGGNNDAIMEETTAHADILNREDTVTKDTSDQKNSTASDAYASSVQRDEKLLRETDEACIGPDSIPHAGPSLSKDGPAEQTIKEPTADLASIAKDLEDADTSLTDAATKEAYVNEEKDTPIVVKIENAEPTHLLKATHDVSDQVQNDSEGETESTGDTDSDRVGNALQSSALVSSIDEASPVEAVQVPINREAPVPADTSLSVNGQSHSDESIIQETAISTDLATPKVSEADISAPVQGLDELSGENMGDVTTIVHTADRDAEKLESQTLAATNSESVSVQVADTNTLVERQTVPTSLPEDPSLNVKDPELLHSLDRKIKSEVGSQCTVDEQETPSLKELPENSGAESLSPLSMNTGLEREAAKDPCDSGSVCSKESAPSSREPWTGGAEIYETTDTPTRFSQIDESPQGTIASSASNKDPNTDLHATNVLEGPTKTEQLSEPPSAEQEKVTSPQDEAEPLADKLLDSPNLARAPMSTTSANVSGRRIVTAMPPMEPRPNDTRSMNSTRAVSQPTKPAGHRRTISDILREADAILQASKK